MAKNEINQDNVSTYIKILSPTYGVFKAYIDEEDIPLVEDYKWGIIYTGKSFYVRHSYRDEDKKTKMLFLHRFLTDCPDGYHVDHINHNPLDNRKSNLRVVTPQQNCFNTKNTKGYCWIKKSQKYKAYIKHNRKSIHLGMFDTPEEAKEAYLQAKEELHKI